MPKNNSELTAARFRLWWFPLLVGVVIVLGSMTVLIPKVQSVLQLRDELEADKASLTKLTAKVNQLKEWDETKLQELFTITETALPSNKPLFEVMALLQQLAADSGIIISDYDLSPGSLATPSGESKQATERVALSTSLTVRGSYEQVNQFLDEIQKSMPLITVTSIGFSETNNEMIARLDVEIYYQPLVSGKKSNPEAPLPQFSKESEEILQTLATYKTTQTSGDTGIVDFARQDLFAF